jgi:hypothetical protein
MFWVDKAILYASPRKVEAIVGASIGRDVLSSAKRWPGCTRCCYMSTLFAPAIETLETNEYHHVPDTA